jgi:hypothetical protein
MKFATSFVFLVLVSCNLICAVVADLAMKVIAGTGTTGYSGDDGPGTSAEGYAPLGVWGDKQGNVYFVDYIGAGVRFVNASTGYIQTVMGQGSLLAGFSSADGPGTSISLSYPWQMTADSLRQNIYVTDRYHVWKYDVVSKIASLYAGPVVQDSGNIGDGIPATSALLSSPTGICMSAAGDLYVTDNGVHTVSVITAVDHKISHFAGTFNTAGWAGDGNRYDATIVKFASPLSCYIDTTGVMFIGDGVNRRVRKIDIPNVTGLISTYAGGGSGQTPDGILATSYALGTVYGVMILLVIFLLLQKIFIEL